MKIDFSKCSDEDVAELMIAATQSCYWLCDDQGHGMGSDKISCEIKETCPAYLKTNDVCEMHLYDAITKPEIFRQCWKEIERRARR